MLQVKSSILSNVQLTEDCWLIALEASQIASQARAGQFIHVKIPDGGPFLRRPFSIFRRLKLDGCYAAIEVVYKVVGVGTKIMTCLKPGSEVDIIGPLGHGFEWRQDRNVQLLLAGGIGAAGLFMLGEEISSAVSERGLKLYILLGAETRKSLVLEKEFGTLDGMVFVSTDDGTHGYHGSVTQMLEDYIGSGRISSDCAIYACGPEPMLKVLAPICKHNGIPAQVSMERHMICGIGACLCCVCKVNKDGVLKHRDVEYSHIQFSPGEEWGYALVCKDGPVFNVEEVMFCE